MKATTVRLLLIVLLLFAWQVPARAEKDMEFAAGLKQLGFPELAIEQYRFIAADKNQSDINRINAYLSIVDIYVELANKARTPEDKKENLDAASKVLEEFLKKYPERTEAGRARFRRAQINQDIGREITELIKRTKDKTIARKHMSEAEKYFLSAIKDFDETAAKYKKDADRISPIARRQELKDERAKLLEIYLQALNQSAWTRFYMAEMYELPIINEKNKMREQLLKAAEQFAAFVDKWRGYLITLAAQCGQGQCYRKLAEIAKSSAERKKFLEQAEDAFIRVIRMRRTEEANQIRHLAYLFLSQTYIDAGRYEDAIRNANRFIMEVPEDYDAPIMRAILIEKGKAYFHLVEQMRKQKRPSKEIKDALTKGLNAINKVIEWGGFWAQKATEVKAQWSKKLNLKGTETLPDIVALAKQAMDARKYEEAIGWYEEILRRAEPGVDDKVAADAWYRLGECYFSLYNKLRKTYLMYEAGLAFQGMALYFPDDDRAPHAAYLATLFMGHVYQSEPSDYTANLYRDSLIFLAKNFPDHEKSPEAVFRVGEVLRAEKKFLEAGDLYGTIPRHSKFYEKAAYLSGNAYWSAFLELVANEPQKAASEEGAEIWRKAASKLESFLKWAEQQPEISPEHTAEKRYWMAKAKVRLANIYTHPLIRRDRRALEVLENFEQEYGTELVQRRKKIEEQLAKLKSRKSELEKQIADLKKKKEDATLYENELEVTKGRIEMAEAELRDIAELIPSVIIYRVDGYIGVGELETAEKYLEVLRKTMKDYDIPTQSRLCRRLGGAYVALAEQLRQAKASADELKKAREKAAKYLYAAIDIYPDQSFTEYVWIGTKLKELGDLSKAIAIFELALQKFKKYENTKQYWDAFERLANCYFDAERWDKARALFAKLVEHEPTNVWHKVHLAESYEYAGAYPNALDLWTELTGTLEQGTPLWFKSTYHAVRCLVELQNFDRAYQLVAQMVIIYPEMGGSEQRDEFMKLIGSKFPKEKQEKFEALMKQVMNPEIVEKEIQKIREQRIKELKPDFKK